MAQLGRARSGGQDGPRRDRGQGVRPVGPHRRRPDRVPRRAARRRPGGAARLRHDGPGPARPPGRRRRGGRAARRRPPAGPVRGARGPRRRGDGDARRPAARRPRPALEIGAGPGGDGDVRHRLALPQPAPAGFGRPVGRYYATRFLDAAAVAEHVAANFDRLRSKLGSGARPGTIRRCLTGSSTGCSSTRRSWRPRRPTASPTGGSTAGRASAAARARARTSGTMPTPWPGSFPNWSAPPARCRTSARALTTPASSTFAAKRPAPGGRRPGRLHPPRLPRAPDVAGRRVLQRNWPRIKMAMEYLIGTRTTTTAAQGRPAQHARPAFSARSAMTSLYLAALRAARRWPARWATTRSPRGCGDLRARQRQADGRAVQRRISTTPDPKDPEALGRRRLRRPGVRPKLGVPGRPGPHPA